MLACTMRVRWFAAGGLVATILWMLVGGGLERPGHNAAAAATPAVQAEAPPAVRPTDGKLRIICFGAHPDDNEFRAAGSAALWAAQGHHVKFVSVTNGDVGHWGQAGGPLARRRTAEVQQAAKLLGIETEVLDIHDGELLPTLDNRKTITRLIREWHADIVITHRPNDYHPDHRNVGILVQDAAYMVTVPFFCPDVPHLTQNPVFLYYEDHFQKPNPFSADMVVGIDTVLDKKLATVELLASQTLEGGCNGSPDLFPPNAQAQEARRKDVRRAFERRFAGTAEQYRQQLASWYGDTAAQRIQHAEAFEVCEYGRRPTRDELRRLFPFFDSP